LLIWYNFIEFIKVDFLNNKYRGSNDE